MPTSTGPFVILSQSNDQVWGGESSNFSYATLENNMRISLTNGNKHMYDYLQPNGEPYEYSYTTDAHGYVDSITVGGVAKPIVATYTLTGAALLADGSRVLDAELKVVVYNSNPSFPFNGHYTLAVIPEDGDAFDLGSALKQFEVHNVCRIDTAVPCFTAGTKIATPAGLVKVEDLRAGDRVLTLDGEETIKWICSTAFNAKMLRDDPRKVPVRIAKGALGNNLPEQGIALSPQHRVAVTGANGELALVAVGKLSGRVDGITPAGKYRDTGVNYFHIATAQHAVMLTAGIGAESLYAKGEKAMEFMSGKQRAELTTAFGDTLNDMQPAAPFVANVKALGTLDRPLVDDALATRLRDARKPGLNA